MKIDGKRWRWMEMDGDGMGEKKSREEKRAGYMVMC